MTETAVQEKPILFSGAMVRAILEGRKTQTRRVIKTQPTTFPDQGSGLWHHVRGAKWESGLPYICPYGKPGTYLWVRETFNVGWLDGGKVLYRADGGSAKKAGYPAEPVYKPSIHMPRWASRITLEIVSIKVERVQDISEAGAISEGIYRGENGFYANYPEGETVPGWRDPRKSFQSLWDSINLDRGYGWENNPFVWAIEFKRLEGKR